MSDFDDIVDDDDDPDLNDNPDDSSVMKRLRKQAREGRTAVRERDALKEENVTLRNEKLLREAKLDSLKPSQQNAVLRGLEGEATVESLKAQALELGFIEAEPEPEPDPDEVAQEQMADAAANGGKERGNSADTITVADFAKWDMPRKKDFITRYPDKFAALKRGEKVRLSG